MSNADCNSPPAEEGIVESEANRLGTLTQLRSFMRQTAAISEEHNIFIYGPADLGETSAWLISEGRNETLHLLPNLDRKTAVECAGKHVYRFRDFPRERTPDRYPRSYSELLDCPRDEQLRILKALKVDYVSAAAIPGGIWLLTREVTSGDRLEDSRGWKIKWILNRLDRARFAQADTKPSSSKQKGGGVPEQRSSQENQRQPGIENPVSPGRGPQPGTVEKAKKLVAYRKSMIKDGEVRLGWTDACASIPIDMRTVAKHWPDLHGRWNDPTYEGPDDLIESRRAR